MSMLLNPFLLAAAGAPSTAQVRALKHYIIARAVDAARVRAVKHYIIARPI